MDDSILPMQEVVDQPIPVFSTASGTENSTSSCDRNSIGHNVVSTQECNSSDQTCIYLGVNKKREDNLSLLSRVNKDTLHSDCQMRSLEPNCLTGFGSHTSEQLMTLGRQCHRQKPYSSPSSYPCQNSCSGLEAPTSNPHSPMQVAGKIRTETSTHKAKPEYLTSYATAPLNIRSSFLAARKVDFSPDDNSEKWYTRQDRFTAITNCNCQPIDGQNELVDSVRKPQCGDPSLGSQWHLNDEGFLLSREMHHGDEIPSLSGQWNYGDEIPSLSSQWHYGSQIRSHSSQQNYGDEIPSLSRHPQYRDKNIALLSSQWCCNVEVPSLSSHRQVPFCGNGYLKDNIAGKVAGISQQVKMSKNEYVFTKPRMANRVESGADHYKMSKNNMWQNGVDIRDQVRGPRANKMNGTLSPSTKKDIFHPLICRDYFNRADFSVQYEHAKFFMIKSHCEDDIHKGIKYNVWASTPNGNNKLDAAFHEVHILMKEKGQKCPVFLFFSVNGSGQFVGLAEMLGPIDFKKTMDFWQQNKWNGFFPLMWHIIKDIPNRHFEHITLENNDNRMVTFSRDTQEIPLPQGLEMLNIFKGHPMGTSILEDFDYYEEKENSRHARHALKRNPQSTHQARLPNEFKSMKRLEAEMKNLSFSGTRD